MQARHSYAASKVRLARKQKQASAPRARSEATGKGMVRLLASLP